MLACSQPVAVNAFWFVDVDVGKTGDRCLEQRQYRGGFKNWNIGELVHEVK
jgi:hypothetical protein